MAKKIMVVDDDPDLREATEIVLSSAGYDVALAAMPPSAWKWSRPRPWICSSWT